MTTKRKYHSYNKEFKEGRLALILENNHSASQGNSMKIPISSCFVFKANMKILTSHSKRNMDVYRYHYTKLIMIFDLQSGWVIPPKLNWLKCSRE